MVVKSCLSWSRVMFCVEIPACLGKEYFVLVTFFSYVFSFRHHELDDRVVPM
jgi:hypothetical protein